MTDLLIIGTRGRIQRSERVDQRQSREMDAYPVGRPGCDVRVAVVSFEKLLHQAEAYVDLCLALHRLLPLHKRTKHEIHQQA